MPIENNRTMSWGIVVLFLFIFWPIGLILLFKKLATDKSATIKCGRSLTRISYVMIGIGLICLVAMFGGSTGMVGPTIIFLGGGIWVNRIGKRTTITGERYKKYISLIVNQRQTSIDNIAAAVGVPYNVAVADLQKMISSGFFTGAFIDVVNREIVLAVAAPQVNPMAVATAPQIKVAACGSCGANNRVVVGQLTECEYCGSHL